MTTTNTLKKIGYVLRFHRRLQGLTQIDLAQKLEISHRNLQRIENGEVEPKLMTLNKIASLFKLPISSLVRATDLENLFLVDLTTSNEMEQYNQLLARPLGMQDDVAFAERLVQQDKVDLSGFHNDMAAVLEGTNLTCSAKLADITGLSTQAVNIDQFLAYGSSVERWELVCRARIKKALLRNFYHMPKGFKVLESLHMNIDANPDAPVSECLVRDVTYRHQLESWIHSIRAQAGNYKI